MHELVQVVSDQINLFSTMQVASSFPTLFAAILELVTNNLFCFIPPSSCQCQVVIAKQG